MKPLIYIAGPYTYPDPISNVRRAIEAAEEIEGFGGEVFIPHLSMLWDLVSPASYERWCERDNAVLARCDALYRMDGESLGADEEVSFSLSHDIPVLRNVTEATLFINNWAEDREGLAS